MSRTDHYVQYHNEQRMRGPPAEMFTVYTDKTPSKDVISARIWLIVGLGRTPERYALHSTFIADRVVPSTRQDFSIAIRGSDGKRFDPPLAIDDEHWFLDLQRLTANFLGFTRITDTGVIGGLRTIAGV